MGRFVNLLALLLAIYAGSYAAFRQTNQEVWPKDKRTYVIFPSGAAGQHSTMSGARSRTLTARSPAFVSI
jgi:hypothetical protein